MDALGRREADSPKTTQVTRQSMEGSQRRAMPTTRETERWAGKEDMEATGERKFWAWWEDGQLRKKQLRILFFLKKSQMVDLWWSQKRLEPIGDPQKQKLLDSSSSLANLPSTTKQIIFPGYLYKIMSLPSYLLFTFLSILEKHWPTIRFDLLGKKWMKQGLYLTGVLGAPWNRVLTRV